MTLETIHYFACFNETLYKIIIQFITITLRITLQLTVHYASLTYTVNSL